MNSRQPFSTTEMPGRQALRPAGAFLRYLILIVLVGLVPLAGYLAVRIHGPQIEREAYANLEVIAALKAGQIERCFDERYSEGMAIMSSSAFVRLLQAVRGSEGGRLHEDVRPSLINALGLAQYQSALLVSPEGSPVLALGDRQQLAPESLNRLSRSLAMNRPVFSDLIVDADGFQHIDLIVPLSLLETGWRDPLGFIVLSLAPEAFLFPYVQSWPTASASGEVLLVRREDDSIVYLTSLKDHDGDSPAPKISFERADVLAVTAIREARVGTREGDDYRGVPVFSAFRPVKGTEWMLLAKQDRDEVMAPMRDLSFWVGLVTLLGVIVVGVVMRRLWLLYEQTRRLEIQTQSDAVLRRFYDMPFIGISVRAIGTDHWAMVNDFQCHLFGYSREEMLTLRWQDVCHPEDIEVTAAAFARLEAGESAGELIEKRFIRKDGSLLDAAVDIRAVCNAQGGIEYLFAVVQDISERKAAEARIHRLTSIYAALSETNQAIVRATTAEELFPQICRFAVDHGGMQMAWIGLRRTDSAWIRPVASYGVGANFTEQVSVSEDPLSPHGAGVTGMAIRSGEPCWMGDYLNEATALPWHEYAERYHWRSAAALPLRQGGEVIGALVLFSTEVNAFDEQIRSLLVEMAQDVSFALTQFVKEQERTKTEAELRLAAQVFEQSAEAVMICDPDCRIMKVNRVFSAITGYDEADVLGQEPVFLLAMREDIERYPAMLASVFQEGNWQGEVLGRRKNGELFPQLLSLSRVLDGEGRISHNVGMFRDISEQRASQERIQRLAHFDALTGLPNRRLLEDRVGQVLNRVTRSGERMSLVFIDLDRFKNVNDSLGHRIGDDLLVQVADRLRETLREDDTVARLGGDEFILVLPETGVRGASRVAEKVMMALSQPYRIDQHELIVTPSLGIAIYPDDGVSYEILSRCADAAMYRAKEAGRNTFRFFTREMQERSDRVLCLENALRRALELGQLDLHYQPQISLETNRVIGVEALIRWTHPELGVISPSEFIPICEDSGMIVQVGEWVLRTAVGQLKKWQQTEGDFFTPLVMAVNISAVQFLRGGLPELVSGIMSDYQLPSDCLELELTERVALGSPDEAIKRMEELHARGIRLSIDDFGTGYSSLSYLKRFKAYKLKIDQSFVRDISSDPDDRAIVEAIINMASSLGMRTIAEGVETAEQMAYLYERNCDEAQGYFIARPMPAAEFEDFVRNFKLLG